jgi:hypothetical protein
MEHGGALEHLQHNVKLNRVICPRVETAPCDWNLFQQPTQATSTLVATNDDRTGADGGSGNSSGSYNSAGAVPVGAASSAEAAAKNKEAVTDALIVPVIGGGERLMDTAWDFIIGSDLVYLEEGAKMLPRVLAGLAGPTTTILYCHSLYRYEDMDYDFLDECASALFPSPPFASRHSAFMWICALSVPCTLEEASKADVWNIDACSRVIDWQLAPTCDVSHWNYTWT